MEQLTNILQPKIIINTLYTSKMLAKDHAIGFQSFFKVLTHISPFSETLGWNIFVIKYPFGGLLGKSLSTANLHLNTPPS